MTDEESKKRKRLEYLRTYHKRPEVIAARKKKSNARYAQDAARREKMRNYSRQYLYGLMAEMFTDMYEAQDAKCAICLREIPKEGRATHIDHCHVSGKVRGLLCNHCNRVLGHIERVGLQPFRDYLERHG